MQKTKMTATVVLALCLMVLIARISEAAPVGAAFTYQGSLNDAGAPADGQEPPSSKSRFFSKRIAVNKAPHRVRRENKHFLKGQ